MSCEIERNYEINDDFRHSHVQSCAGTDKFLLPKSTTLPSPVAANRPERPDALEIGLEGWRHHEGGTIRPSVARFARLMETRLRANEHRGGWHDCLKGYLMERIEANLRDLRFNQMVGRTKEKNSEALQVACGDIGNFAMMLAENDLFKRGTDGTD